MSCAKLRSRSGKLCSINLVNSARILFAAGKKFLVEKIIAGKKCYLEKMSSWKTILSRKRFLAKTNSKQLLFSHFDGLGMQIFGMPPYFDPTRRNMWRIILKNCSRLCFFCHTQARLRPRLGRLYYRF